VIFFTFYLIFLSFFSFFFQLSFVCVDWT
jgi:hypothetical protein